MIINTLQVSASSNAPLIEISKRDQKFPIFCACWITLLLGSSLQLFSSYLPDDYDRQAYQRAFTGRRFFSEGVGRQIITEDSVYEVRQAVHTEVYRDEAGLYCNRTHYRTDVCVATGGDVRVLGGSPHGGSYQVLVSAEQGQEKIERVKPYTRKWETSVMDTIDEVMVIKKVHLNGAGGSEDSSLLIRSAQQSKNFSTPYYRPAKLQRISRPLSIKPQQRKQVHSSIQRHRHKRLFPIHHSSGNSKELQQLSEARRAVVQGSHDQVRVQERKVSATTRAALQRAVKPSNDRLPDCEVRHEVPAILFSTGGYTGNVYHEFNDGLIPLFITAQQYSPGQVVLIVLEYHNWWMSRYAEVLAQVSNYTVIDLARDKRVHCFPEVTVGLNIHGELAIHAENPDNQASMQGFQALLRAAYVPRAEKEAVLRRGGAGKQRPRLLLFSRSSPRAILNEQEVVAMAKDIGFSVQVLAPTPRTRMVHIYNAVSSCDVMLGVHGAAMTHLLFMRPGAIFVQVVPLGTEWAAATYYGEPAQKLGLDYVAYRVSAQESSLWQKYARDDPVLVNPETVNKKGWWETKRIYLEAQDVIVSLPRMRVTLLSAYDRVALTLSSSQTPPARR